MLSTIRLAWPARTERNIWCQGILRITLASAPVARDQSVHGRQAVDTYLPPDATKTVWFRGGAEEGRAIDRPAGPGQHTDDGTQVGHEEV